MDIQGSAAFVTGANRGIGLVVARALVAAGAKVYGGARDPELVTEPGVVPVRLDVTDPASADAAAELASDTRILVNNAGLARPGSILTAEEADVRRQFEVNVFGTWAVTRAFAPVLGRNGGGAVVNVLSVASWRASQIGFGYSASKTAQWALTNSTRLTLREQGTLVSGVHVGFVDTDLAAAVDQAKLAPEVVAEAIVEGLRADREEILVDELSRQVKANLSADVATMYPVG
ncbi:NAD(P)-dependent dehydrogenase (short-subunit alcohol dehydrogenase family) [Crossiella equi]|uniref:NAD(P)-dependent dehydrogenase (Short-subunit alcohol dehydrogenase family) n=1 Tax=Crossiella equi TaxID=130796 RepID=A0ABS5APG0_9PSEU|nr:SDR family oxidoreductase [Crossiella equi]MBP2478462.1 NAD(P)-dependent dehydrogenase (short-subunit alcohol dehydrogenase family) [Crossiella equi]